MILMIIEICTVCEFSRLFFPIITMDINTFHFSTPRPKGVIFQNVWSIFMGPMEGDWWLYLLPWPLVLTPLSFCTCIIQDRSTAARCCAVFRFFYTHDIVKSLKILDHKWGNRGSRKTQITIYYIYTLFENTKVISKYMNKGQFDYGITHLRRIFIPLPPSHTSSHFPSTPPCD